MNDLLKQVQRFVDCQYTIGIVNNKETTLLTCDGFIYAYDVNGKFMYKYPWGSITEKAAL